VKVETGIAVSLYILKLRYKTTNFFDHDDDLEIYLRNVAHYPVAWA
jgi:hypothetical protein